MSGLVVDESKCVGCRRCERVCANAGIEVVERRAHVLDGSALAAACASMPVRWAPCPSRRTLPLASPSTSTRTSGVCSGRRCGHGASRGARAAGRARELADERGCGLAAVVGEAAEADDDNARTLMGAGADEVIRTCDDRLAHADAEVFAAWLADLANTYKPEVILYGATNFGRELAPRVAVLLQTGLTADCTVLEMDAEAGLLQQTRPAFGGNLMATIVSEPPSADGHRAPRHLCRARAARGAQRHRDRR